MSRTQLVFTGAYTETPHPSSGLIPGGKGIRAYRFDPDRGSLALCSVAEGVRNPSYLAFHPLRPFLYAVNELKEFEGAAGGAVSAFAVDAATGELTFLNRKPTHGADPCHLVVDPTGRWVLVANYSGGSVAVLPVREDGSLGDATDVVQHRGSSVHGVRQAGPHPHYVTFDRGGQCVFVCDLGMARWSPTPRPGSPRGPARARGRSCSTRRGTLPTRSTSWTPRSRPSGTMQRAAS